MDLTAEIEALLYVSGENGMTIKQLQKFTGADIDKIKWSIAKLKQRYDDVMYGICILQNGDIIHMATKRVYSDVISNYVNTDDELLTQSALETLTIIAYKQPITRVEIDEVRGLTARFLSVICSVKI